MPASAAATDKTNMPAGWRAAARTQMTETMKQLHPKVRSTRSKIQKILPSAAGTVANNANPILPVSSKLTVERAETRIVKSSHSCEHGLC